MVDDAKSAKKGNSRRFKQTQNRLNFAALRGCFSKCFSRKTDKLKAVGKYKMKAWEDFLKKKEKEIGKETTERWLRSLKVVHFDACNLYLEAKNSLQTLWFEEHIRPKLKFELRNNNHRFIKVHLTISQESLSLPSKKKAKKEDTPPPSPSLFSADSLDPQALWDYFIPTEGNLIPLQLLKELIGQGKSAFNPIYIYGESGSGKTHLLMALAHAFQKKGLKALYLRTETFTEHVVAAIRKGMMREFRKITRNTDLLLIDDVHHFARRVATQEELFHTFNALHTERKQIVLAGPLLPKYLDDIEPRLISRFEWGICLKVEKLEEGALKELLQSRLRAHHFTLAEEIQLFLIETFKQSSHFLVQAVETLILRSHLEKSLHITLREAKEFLKDLIRGQQLNALTPEKIIRAVAESFEISFDDILSKSQSQEHSLPRQIAIYLCRHELKLPFQTIGKIFSRDHSTIMTSVKLVQEKVNSKELFPRISEIRRKLSAALSPIEI
jgi:chromosomal replication initiator protein